MDTFPTFSSSTDAPIFARPTFKVCESVSEDEDCKIINDSPIKSCLLDLIPQFFLNDCLNILLPSIKLVNYSLVEGSFLMHSKRLLSLTPLIKKASLLCNELKNYHQGFGLCFVSKLVELVVANQLKSCIISNSWIIFISVLTNRLILLKLFHFQ